FLACLKSPALRVSHIARRAVGDVRYDGIWKTSQKSARADCFIIRMRDNHQSCRQGLGESHTLGETLHDFRRYLARCAVTRVPIRRDDQPGNLDQPLGQVLLWRLLIDELGDQLNLFLSIERGLESHAAILTLRPLGALGLSCSLQSRHRTAKRQFTCLL